MPTNTPPATDTPVMGAPIHITGLKELAEILIRHFQIHEGYYQVAVGFRLGVGNVQGSPDNAQALPGAIVGVENLSLMRVPNGAENLTVVDAALVNPTTSRRTTASAAPKVTTPKAPAKTRRRTATA